MQSPRECVFVDVWYFIQELISEHHVECVSRLVFVAGISAFVIVSRSASVHFLVFLLSPVSSLSVFMSDRAFVLPLAVSQPHVCHRQETGNCLHRLAHAAARGNLDRDTSESFVPVNASSNCISTRVSRTAGRPEPTFVSSDFEPEKHLPDSSATPLNSTEIEHGMTVRV